MDKDQGNLIPSEKIIKVRLSVKFQRMWFYFFTLMQDRNNITGVKVLDLTIVIQDSNSWYCILFPEYL